MEENLKVVWAKFSTLSEAILLCTKRILVSFRSSLSSLLLMSNYVQMYKTLQLFTSIFTLSIYKNQHYEKRVYTDTKVIKNATLIKAYI